MSERSQVNLKNATLQNGKVAMASTDSSIIIGTDISIANFQVGMAAYRKKSEFGPAQVTVKGLVVSRVETDYLVEDESSVVIDDRAIQDKKSNIASLLDGKGAAE